MTMSIRPNSFTLSATAAFKLSGLLTSALIPMQRFPVFLLSVAAETLMTSARRPRMTALAPSTQGRVEGGREGRASSAEENGDAYEP